MSLLTTARRRLSERTREQMKLWQSASAGSRALLMSAVFFLFSSIGLLSDVLSLGRAGFGKLLLVATLGGVMAMLYLWVIIRNLLWLPLAVLLQIALSLALDRLPGTTPIVPPGPVADALTKRLTVNTMAAVGCISISYALFITFVTRSGRQVVQLDTELQLARDIH